MKMMEEKEGKEDKEGKEEKGGREGKYHVGKVSDSTTHSPVGGVKVNIIQSFESIPRQKF